MLVKDGEAAKWRKEHKAQVEEQIQGFIDRVYRKSESKKSAENKYVGIASLCGWLKKLPNQILEDIKSGRTNPYKMLDDFVGYLVKTKYAPNATKNYESAVRKWLGYNEVELSSEKLRNMVELPRQYSITDDRIPTSAELRDMVVVSKPRGKALITMLASSGLRVGELLALKVGDLDFDKHPTRIRLKARATKDRQARWCFISDEATAFLKDYLKDRIAQKDSFVFLGRHQGLNDEGEEYKQRRVGNGIENKPISYWNCDYLFTLALKNARIYEKDENNRDVIHIHCLRKFFFTKMLSVLGREITEAVIGHKEYLDSAYRRYTIDELGEHYLKGMDAVTVMSVRNFSREDLEKQIKLGNYKFYLEKSGLGDSPQELLDEEEVSKGRKLTADEQLALFEEAYLDLKRREDGLLEQGTKRVFGEPGVQKDEVIPASEVKEYVKRGYEFKSLLPDGMAVVRG